MSTSLEIVEDEVQAGQEISPQLQSPEDKPFINEIRIFKDPSPEDVANDNWPLVNMIGSISILAEQSSVEIGAPFVVNVDTLNYAPGEYYFVTFAVGDDFVHDHVQITPMDEVSLTVMRSDMTDHNRTFALYAADAAVIAAASADFPPPVVFPNSVYALAVNLNMFQSFNNTIHVNFFDSAGVVLEKVDIMKIYVLRGGQGIQTVTDDPGCEGEPVDLDEYPDGIALIHFRMPKHQKYYEYDGQLHFTLSGKTSPDPGCEMEYFTIEIHLDDTPAHSAIPTFDEYNADIYPGQLWRNDFPFDTRHVRIARFGNVRLANPAELEDLVPQFESEFPTAAKNYFRVVVDAYHIFPLVQEMNQEKVINWYQSVPKTPGKDVLNLADPNQLYLATLLYYYEHNETEFVNDMKAVYPMLSNGEDLTLYLFDGPGKLGRAMGADGNRVKVTRLYPGYVFYQGEGEERTYHLDLEAFASCGDTVEEYLDYMEGSGSTVQTINTMIHELGHTYWLKKAGISTGDLSTRKLPFWSDTVYEDDSTGYFTRFEYMSYGRDRSTLEGMSYGDAYLERILAAYARPEAWIELVSHEDEGEQTITVTPGEEIVFRLYGSAGSGLRMLWYFNQASPVPLEYGTPEKFGVYVYNTDGPRVKLDHKDITMMLSIPGSYVYLYRARSRLYAIAWQPHQSAVGSFTINVQA